MSEALFPLLYSKNGVWWELNALMHATAGLRHMAHGMHLTNDGAKISIVTVTSVTPLSLTESPFSIEFSSEK